METNGSQPKVVVVGAGLAGLTCAVRLAQQGVHVEVLERSNKLGGRAATSTKNGYQLNLGPHALYCSGAARKELTALGIEIRGNMARARGLLLKNGKKHLQPIDGRSLWFTRALSFRGKLQFIRFFGRINELEPEQFNHVPLADWLGREFPSRDVRGLMQALTRLITYANAPEIQSTGAVLQQLRISADGVLYLDGGWQSLIDRLQDKATEVGVRIRPNSPVKALEGNGRVSKVILKNDESIEADAVVLATTLDHADQILPEHWGTRIHELARSCVPVTANCLDIGMSAVPDPKTTFAIGIDEPLYFSNHSRAAQLAPAGGSLIHVAAYLGPQVETDTSFGRLERLMDQLQPGWRKYVEHSRQLSNFLVASMVDEADRGGTAGRPGVAVDGVTGVFVCGDWVGPEGLLADASVASAVQAASLAAKVPQRAAYV